MKNVMTRAWEIAKTASSTHGGKAAEYIAEALKMAWGETKGLGFREVAKQNGVLHFVVNNIADLEVSFVSYETSVYNGKTIARRQKAGYKEVIEKATGKTLRLYNTTITRATFEFKYGGKVQTLNIDRGRLEWAN